MSGDTQGDREKRDAVLARLLAEALAPAAADAGGAGSPVCPDAEVLAAYADHELDPEETRKWESHFADCGRCRKILAVLTVNTQEPLTDQEVERFGQLAAMAEVPSVPARPAQAAARPRIWRWLAPALGAAAGVLLWFALRPVVTRLMPSQQVAEKTATAPATPAAPGSATGDSEMARVNVPPAAAASEPTPQTMQTAPAGMASGTISKKGDREEASNAATTAAGTAMQATPMRAAGAQQAGEAANAPQQKTSPAATAAAHPVTAAAEAKTAEQALRLPNAASRSRTRALEMGGAAGASVFSSPDRNVMWRIGPDGSINRSTDNGRTWQKQASGVTADLLAGAAASKEVAWVAGQDVILRTTDGGENWQRIAPPGGEAAEWTDIAASDALHVTIAGSVPGKGQRRFHSDDGGKSWTPQQ